MRSGWWLPGLRRGAKNVAMTTRPAIGIESLTKSYGDKHVLRGLDLRVPTGFQINLRLTRTITFLLYKFQQISRLTSQSIT